MSWLQDSIREDLIRGIAAAKSGDADEAKRYLERVLRMKPDQETAIQAWLWLSEVDRDPARRRAYLEEVLGREPTNAAARQGLAILDGRLRPEQIVDPTALAERATASSSVEPAASQRFVCPQCGGHMAFDPDKGHLTCEYCAYSMSEVESRWARPEPPEKDFFTVLATAKGHVWQQTAYSVKCSGCGVTTLLPTGQISGRCPFCGSPQVVRIDLNHDVIEPQSIIPFRITSEQAIAKCRAWMEQHALHPTTAAGAGQLSEPRGVYLPYWSFSFIGTATWSAQIQEWNGLTKEWRTQQEEFSCIEDHILVPASHTLPAGPLRALNQFDLTALRPYSPELLADWPAEIYQISAADASIVARGKVRDLLQRQAAETQLSGTSYRSLSISTRNVGIDSFQHLLLPVWVFQYQHRNKSYYVLVNGQSGEVEGEKPAGRGPLWLLAILAVAVIILFAVLAYLVISARNLAG